jgi:hypothetical protein
MTPGPQTIRTAKRRARQTDIGITLGLLLLLFETIRKMPRLLQLALGVGALWAGFQVAAHWRVVLGLILGLIGAWFIRREIHRADWGSINGWHMSHDPDYHHDYHEFRNGGWHHREEGYDDIPY